MNTLGRIELQIRVHDMAALRQAKREMDALRGSAVGMNKMGGFGGFRGLEKAGKDLQWTGRQIEFRFTLPLILAGVAATKFALDNEAAMTRVRKVYGDLSMTQQQTDRDIRQLGEAFRALSDIFGVQQSEVIEIAATWAQAGAVSVGLARDVRLTLEAMVLGEIEAADAARDLIAIQSQWGLNTNELRKALAVLNIVENETTASFPDLISSMVRAGGTARTAGIDIQHLAAMTAALVPAAGTASQAGNSLKTIISRLLVPTEEATALLAELGFNIESSSWKSLNGSQRLEELAKAFDGLTQNQKAYVSTTIATRFQVSRFDILMRDLINPMGQYQKALKASSDEQRNFAQYQKEIGILLASDPQRFKIMTTMLQNMMAEIILPLMPAILGLMQRIVRLVDAFTNLDPAIQQLVIGGLAMLAFIGPLLAYIGTFGVLIGRTGIIVGSLTKHLWKLAFGFKDADTGARKASGAFRIFGQAVGSVATGSFRVLYMALGGLGKFAVGAVTVAGNAVLGLGRLTVTVARGIANGIVAGWQFLVGLFTRLLAFFETASAASAAASTGTIFVANTAAAASYASLAAAALLPGAAAVQSAALAAGANVAAAAQAAIAWAGPQLAITAFVAYGELAASTFAASWVAAATASAMAFGLLPPAAAIAGAEVVAIGAGTALAYRGEMLALGAGGDVFDGVTDDATRSSGRIRKIFAGLGRAIVAPFGWAAAAVRAIWGGMMLAFAALAPGFRAAAAAVGIAITESFAITRVAIQAIWLQLQMWFVGTRFIWQQVGGQMGAFLSLGFQFAVARIKVIWMLLQGWFVNMKNIWRPIGSAIGGAFSAAWAVAAGAVRVAWAAIVAWIQASAPIVARIGAAIGGAMSAAFAAASAAARWVWQAIAVAIAALSPVFSAVGAFLGSVMSVAFEAGVAVAAALGPEVLVGLAIAAAVAIAAGVVYALRDPIMDGLTWMGDMVIKSVEWIPDFFRRIFNMLPNAVQAAIVRVIAILRGAAMAIAEWLSYLNPFAKHSPSLVEQVSAGVDLIAGKYASLRNIGSGFRQAIADINAFKDAVAGAVAALDAQERGENRQAIVEYAGPQAGPAVDQAYAAVDRLRGDKDAVAREFAGQEVVVARLDLRLQALNRTYDVASARLETLKARAESTSDALDEAKQVLDDLANTGITGMRASSDAIFANEIAQKRLRLEILKMGEAGETVEDVQQRFAALSGDLEMMQSHATQLQLAGAGSDVLGPINAHIDQIEAARDALEGTGPSGGISELQLQLEELQRQGEIMDLENAIRFDPLTRQIDALTNGLKEMPFDQLKARIQSQQNEVTRLTAVWDQQTAAVRDQEAVVDRIATAREALQVVFDQEKEKLDALGDTYDALEQQIRDMEAALNDFATSAKTALDAAKSAAEAGAAAGAGGGVAEEFAAQGGGDFEVPEGTGGIEQQFGDIQKLADQWAEESKKMLGDLDMFGPIKDMAKDAWNWIREQWDKLWDWSADRINEFIDWITGAWDDLDLDFDFGGGNILERAKNLGGQIVGGIVAGIAAAWRGLTAIPILGPILENIRRLLKLIVDKFVEFGRMIGDELRKWAPLWDQVMDVMQRFGDNAKLLFDNFIFGVRFGMGIILAIFQFVWPTISAVVTAAVQIIMGVITAAWQILGPITQAAWDLILNILVVVFNFIIEAVRAALEIVRGIISFVLAIISGDWGKAWDAILLILRGIWDLIFAIVRGVFGLVMAVIKTVLDNITRIWAGAWNAIKTLLAMVWQVILTLIRGGLQQAQNTISLVMGFISGVWNFIWTGIKNTAFNIWESIKGIIFGGIAVVRNLLAGAGALFSGAWSSIKAAFAGPVNWVIANVINGFIGAINSVSRALGGGNLVGEIQFRVPERHEGGIIGEAGRRTRQIGGRGIGDGIGADEELTLMQRGEGVIPRDAMAKMTRDEYEMIRRGDTSFVKTKASDSWSPLPDKIPDRNPEGGWLGDTWNAISDPIGTLLDAAREVISLTARPAINGLLAMVDATVGQWGPPGQLVGAGAHKIGQKVLEWIDRADEDARVKKDELGGDLAAWAGREGSYRAIIKYLESRGIPHRVTSTVRPGSITSSGNLSLHSMGRAVDLGAPGDFGRDTDGLGRIFHAFKPVEGMLAELIYAGPQTGYNIKNGAQVAKYAVNDHHDHVHAALAAGGVVKRTDTGTVVRVAEGGRDEAIIPLPADWRNNGKGAETHNHFHGDLIFPNITDGDDAELLIRNLESMA